MGEDSLAQAGKPDKPSNRSLNAARASKRDEFYTQFSDIEKELRYYRKHFKNKIVLCNCDDPRTSNFVRYFLHNFETLGLTKLIATSYKNSDADLFDERLNGRGSYLEYDGARIGNRVPNPDEIGVYDLQGDGDFRGEECVERLRQADIVVTNPPFSLFREYVTQLMAYGKKLLVIGNQTAIVCKDIFKLFKENRIWLGASIHSGDREFGVPEFYPLIAANSRVDSDGNKFVRVKGVRWFTNMDYEERHAKLALHEPYVKAKYPKFDHYDAINVDRTKDIPVDYAGAMGVPLTFMDKYSPEQFEIVDGLNRYSFLYGPTRETKGKYLSQINGKCIYSRIIIRSRT